MINGVTLAASSISEHPLVAACYNAEQSAIDVRRWTRDDERYDFLKPSQRPTATAGSSNRARTRNVVTVSPTPQLPESDSDGDALLKELKRKQ